MKSQVPRGVPGVFPLVWDRDDVAVGQVRPVGVPYGPPASGGGGRRRVSVQPFARRGNGNTAWSTTSRRWTGGKGRRSVGDRSGGRAAAKNSSASCSRLRSVRSKAVPNMSPAGASSASRSEMDCVAPGASERRYQAAAFVPVRAGLTALRLVNHVVVDPVFHITGRIGDPENTLAGWSRSPYTATSAWPPCRRTTTRTSRAPRG